MKKNTTLSIALTAGLVALMGLPGLAAADHDYNSGASCSLPTDYPSAHVRSRRRAPVERRLTKRLKRTRQEVRTARGAMEGLSHWRTEQQVREARRRVTEARSHIDNGAFRAANRTLARVDELVRLIRNKARELDRIRSAARSEMRDYRRRLAQVQRRVDEANCTLAAGHLRKAEGSFARARREAGQLDWDVAKTYARKATAHQRDALNKAVATLKMKRQRRRYEEALSALESDLNKARRAGSRRGRGHQAMALFHDARRLKSQAESAARKRQFERAAKLARKGSTSARGALEMTVASTRRGRRRARAARSYRTEMPFASASARWTSSEDW